jgi:proteic killer suppression protein
MTRSFKNRRTEAFHGCERIARFQSFSRQAYKRQRVLKAADALEALMRLPSNRFEAFPGDCKGQFSTRVNERWRIRFEWREDGAHNVELVDCD